MATIEKRGRHQYRARVRLKTVRQSRTFETKREAEDWAIRLEGKVRGDEFIDRKLAMNTTVRQAIYWFLDRIAPVDPSTNKRHPRSDHAKNQLSHANYWLKTNFADYALTALQRSHLEDWRATILDEENRDAGEMTGPNAQVGPQTVIHRLNFLSKLYNEWSRRFNVTIQSPVAQGVRPEMPPHRTRRLAPGEEQRLLAECAKSQSWWLKPMIELALATAMRQGEIRTLTWGQIDVAKSSIFLPKTKNGKERTVPLSSQAKHILGNIPRDAQATDKDQIFPVTTGRSVTRAFSKLCDEANPIFEDLHFHDLRHEATSRLFERTDLRDVEITSITGHKTFEMLKRYSHLRASDLASRLG